MRISLFGVLVSFIFLASGCLSLQDKEICDEGEIKNTLCPDGKTEYLSENCVNNKWVMVNYIRDPCSQLSPQRCDALNPCSEGFECYKFADELSPICWTGDPCEKCESKRCVIAESYPMQVFCQ